jgi:excisionase family DNA binding protein
MTATEATQRHAKGDQQDELGGYDFASKVTGIKVSTLYSLVCEKRIPHVRLSRRMVRFRRSDLEKWLNERAVPVSAPPQSLTEKRRRGESPAALGANQCRRKQ